MSKSVNEVLFEAVERKLETAHKSYVRCGFRDATGLNMPEDGFCSLGKGGQ